MMNIRGSYLVKLFVGVFVFLLFLQVFLVSAVEVTGDYWITKNALPVERVPMSGVVTSNGLIYVITSDAIDVYNPVTDTWTTKTPMPTSRDHFGAAVYKNKIYVIGGYCDEANDRHTVAVNEVYDVVSDTWETKTLMPSARGEFSVNVFNGKIYVIGGSKNRFGIEDIGFESNVNLVYDTATDTWSSKTPIPRQFVGVAPYIREGVSGVIDGKIYLASWGTTDIASWGAIEALTLIYNPVTDTWSYCMPISTFALNAVGGVTTGEMAPKRLYVVGGNSDGTLVQIYDPASDTWVMGSSMPTGRSGCGAVMVNDCLYVIGGTNSNNTHVVANEMYVPERHSSPPPQPSVTLSNTISSPLPNSSSTIMYALVIITVIILVIAVTTFTLKGKKRKNVTSMKTFDCFHSSSNIDRSRWRSLS
ncbi:MAG: hypothetical protein FWH37_00070 [Candidatus Bathyarchaeota archaeon]|nr:hypothetical protein [Candidatus Termiticorpusculum sp.]